MRLMSRRKNFPWPDLFITPEQIEALGRWNVPKCVHEIDKITTKGRTLELGEVVDHERQPWEPRGVNVEDHLCFGGLQLDTDN